MTNPFGYTDPAEAAHPPCPAPVQAPQPVVSPLAGLDQSIPQIMYGNGDTTPPYRNVREDMVTGAVLGGLLGTMLARRRARKAQRLQELKESLMPRETG